jgi:hypothetical protein
MEINIYTNEPENYHGNDMDTYITNKVPKVIKDKYKDNDDININIIGWPTKHINFFDDNENKKFNKLIHCGRRHAIVIIENVENKKYMVVSTWDAISQEVSFWTDFKDNCVELFTSHGMHKNPRTYDLSEIKYTPLSYVLGPVSCEKVVDFYYEKNLEKDERIIPEKLWYKATNPYGFRHYIHKNDSRFEFETGRDTIEEFTKKMSRHKIVMDISGIGGNSIRFAQGMGLGLAVLRPKVKVLADNPVIPNYHFIEVDCDDYSNSEDYSKYKILADAYIDKFEEVKKDEEFINYISKNAREYFDKNCRFNSFFDLVHKKVDLNKLR